jgi:hypothetical protein
MAQVAFFNNDGGRRYGVAVEGIEAFKTVDDLPAQVITAARQAVNKTVDRTRTAAAREIRLQVNFPATYLNPSEGRLAVSQYANGLDLSARIRARQAPTSLARFVMGAPRPLAKGGVNVSVKPGKAVFLPRAFVFPLKNGNLGLAVRTNGPKPSKAFLPKPLGNGLWLLYGPSVDQVFSTVREQIAPDAAVYLEDEFTRLMALNG